MVDNEDYEDDDVVPPTDAVDNDEDDAKVPPADVVNFVCELSAALPIAGRSGAVAVGLVHQDLNLVIIKIIKMIKVILFLISFKTHPTLLPSGSGGM